MPPKHLQKSDEQLYEVVDGKLKTAREALVAKLLERDGGKKEYQDLTTPDLANIAEQLVIRLALFNGEYPAFIPQVVRGVMEHPNLSKADYSKINTFCQMFELDWRGDRAISNKKEFMGSHPIYIAESDSSNYIGYGEIGNFEATAMLRQACVPYVEQLTKKMLKTAQKNRERGSDQAGPRGEKAAAAKKQE